MKAIIAVFLAIFAIGCSEEDVWPRADFELDSGQVVSCRWIEETNCGVDLWDCADGKEYSCQTNVTEL